MRLNINKMSANDEILAELGTEVSAEIGRYIMEKEVGRGRPTWTQTDPKKAAQALMGLSANLPIARVSEELGVSRDAIARLKSDFADHLGKWREMAGVVSGRLYVEGADLVGELYGKIRESLDGDPKLLEAQSKALAAVNKSIETVGRQAMTARGEATEKVEVSHKYTVEDAMELRRKALERIKEQAIDVEEVE